MSGNDVPGDPFEEIADAIVARDEMLCEHLLQSPACESRTIIAAHDRLCVGKVRGVIERVNKRARTVAKTADPAFANSIGGRAA